MSGFPLHSMGDGQNLLLGDASLSRDLFPGDYHCLGDNENRPIKWMPMRCCALRVDSTRLHGSTASAFEDTVVTPDCVESYVDAPWDRAEGSPCWTITNI